MFFMKAVIRDSGCTDLGDIPEPPRPPGWVRLRVLLAAICRTDVQAATGLLPLGGRRVLGHEVVGEVVEADSVTKYGPGDRVAVALPLIPCGDCKACADGNRCVRRLMLGVDTDGAFAEQVVVPEASLRAVPRDLPLSRAACVEPIAAMSAVLGAPIRPDGRGLVLGSGRIADLTGRVLRARGFAGVEAAPALGSPESVNFGGDGATFGYYDFVVEAAGTDEALDLALRSVRPGGVVVLKSRPTAPLAVNVTRAVRNDVTLAAVSYGALDDAVRLAGELEIDDLLGPVYPLARFGEALAASLDQPLGPKIFLAPE
ncbi:zinc-binding dehydrogenase [Streptomyces sp. NPDC088190]|uniref:zinc-dependent alcohol dehydrogenase n=1 Tax=unclassified Streptomyces TaxID=2593676 RepID=UPI002E775AFE|nr:alcohol dehydrogenase catalytic domain-containing protein [Streptomyces sp. JV190]MEE1838374.1 alcohol dehydrogenase catalytic domain-containing protein [Streptomyces sp. JV190]